jgi:6-phosphogluconolactonase
MTDSLSRFATTDALGEAVAARFCEAANEALRARGRFCAVLPGGRTPGVLYAALRNPRWAGQVPWRHSHLFWSDERCVPHTHPDSNYRLAQRELLAQVPIPANHVHRAPADRGTPSQAADVWEDALRAFFGQPAGAGSFPEFDLVVLGIGADGHTASLFPGDAALETSERWTAAVPATGTPPVPRLTLTLPVLNHARDVIFLAAGADKRLVIDRIVAQRDPVWSRRPAALVRPRKRPHWFFSEASL